MLLVLCPPIKLSQFSNFRPRNAKEPAAYRLIKRAQSYIEPKNLDSDDEPHPKRQKTDKPSAPYARNRIYARRTASLRRAESLTVVAEESRRVRDTSICCPAFIARLFNVQLSDLVAFSMRTNRPRNSHPKQKENVVKGFEKSCSYYSAS